MSLLPDPAQYRPFLSQYALDGLLLLHHTRQPRSALTTAAPRRALRVIEHGSVDERGVGLLQHEPDDDDAQGDSVEADGHEGELDLPVDG